MFKLLICRQKIDVNLYILLSQINDVLPSINKGLSGPFSTRPDILY